MGLVLLRSMDRRALIIRVLVAGVVKLVDVGCWGARLHMSARRVRRIVGVGLLRESGLGLCHTDVACMAMVVG